MSDGRFAYRVRSSRTLTSSDGDVPFVCEPLEVRVGLAACLLLAGEQVVGLAQDEDVRAALALGHVRDGYFGGVDPRMDVLSALLGERPLERAPVRCGE